MKSDTKEVGKNTLIYGLGNALNKLLGFILIPIYTSFISINDFGVLSILEVSIIALIQILNFGFVAGHQRYFYIKKENNTYGGFLFSVNVGMLFLVLVFTLPSFFFVNDISKLLFGTIDFNASVTLTIAIIIFEILTIIPFQILQFESKPVLYVILGFIKLLVSLLFTVLFVVEYEMGIYGIMLGRTVGIVFLYALQIILVLRRRLIVAFDFTHLKEVFRYGFPIVFYAISYLIFTFSDRYMLNWMDGSKSVGLYSFGYKMANFVNLIFIQSFGLSYLPSVFKKEKAKDNKIFYSKMLLFYTVIISSIILFFIATYEFALIPFVKNDTYLLGLIIVPIISASFLIHGMNNFASIGIYLKNRTKLLVVTSTVTAVLNIGLNYLMIPLYGYIGAAFATLFSQIVNTSMMTIMSQRLFHINYPWKKISITIFSLSISLAAMFYWQHLLYGYNLIFNIVLVLLFAVIMYWFVLSNDERNTIVSIINKTLKRETKN